MVDLWGHYFRQDGQEKKVVPLELSKYYCSYYYSHFTADCKYKICSLFLSFGFGMGEIWEVDNSLHS